jgi:hypothetical protein
MGFVLTDENKENPKDLDLLGLITSIEGFYYMAQLQNTTINSMSFQDHHLVCRWIWVLSLVYKYKAWRTWFIDKGIKT